MRHLQTFKIKATKGKDLIYDSNLFPYKDSDLVNWGLNQKEKDEKEMEIHSYEIDKEITFIEMMGENPECFTQAQVLEILKNHKGVLLDDCFDNLFPIKHKDGRVFVLYVYLSSDGWSVYVSKLGYGYRWYAGSRLFSRNVVPSDTSVSMTLDNAIKICKENGLKVIRLKTIEEVL